MSPKGGIKPHNKFSVPSKRAEVLFVDYIINHLRPKGRAGIIIPEGIIFQNGNAYKALRKSLIENGLYAVVSLPGGVFQPYSGVKTSILLIDNELAKQKDEIAFVKISADGYDLGSSKREVTQNDLPNALESLKSWANGKSLDNTIFTLVSKEEIARKGDYNLSGDRYLTGVDHSNSVWPVVRLDSICNLVRGVTFSKKDEVFENGQGVLTASNLKLDGAIDLSNLKMVSREVIFKDSQKLVADDIFICLASGSQSHVGKVSYVTSHLGLYFGGFMGSIRVDNNQVNSKYLYYQLRDIKFNDYLSTAISGANIRNLSGEILGSYEIPLPPLEVQEQIVTELDGYAAIISGAKQIVDNWKPAIDNSNNYELVELNQFCKIQNGYAFASTDMGEFQDGSLPVVKIGNVGADGEIDTEFKFHTYSKKLDNFILVPGDIVIAMTGATVGKVATIPKGKFLLNQRVGKVEMTSTEVELDYVRFTLQSSTFYSYCQATATGGAQGNISAEEILKFKIPIAPMNVQLQLIEFVKKEKEQVESLRHLIESYETRSKSVISKLWSE
jgi:type I restriction enzyme M protein